MENIFLCTECVDILTKTHFAQRQKTFQQEELQAFKSSQKDSARYNVALKIFIGFTIITHPNTTKKWPWYETQIVKNWSSIWDKKDRTPTPGIGIKWNNLKINWIIKYHFKMKNYTSIFLIHLHAFDLISIEIVT